MERTSFSPTLEIFKTRVGNSDEAGEMHWHFGCECMHSSSQLFALSNAAGASISRFAGRVVM
jgi:hypothetical protein